MNDRKKTVRRRKKPQDTPVMMPPLPTPLYPMPTQLPPPPAPSPMPFGYIGDFVLTDEGDIAEGVSVTAPTAVLVELDRRKRLIWICIAAAVAEVSAPKSREEIFRRVNDILFERGEKPAPLLVLDKVFALMVLVGWLVEAPGPNGPFAILQGVFREGVPSVMGGRTIAHGGTPVEPA